MLKIRRLKIDDLSFVLQNTEREGWNLLEKDVLRCYHLEPKGCFIAKIDNERVGHVFTFNYGKLGVIGILIVQSKYRGKGIGTKLMEKAIEYLKKQEAETIRLEAVTKAVPLYKRLGFKEELNSLRMESIIEKEKRVENDFTLIRQMKTENLNRIARFDMKYFGANRLKVLEAIYRDYPHLSFFAEENDRTIGYIMAREAGGGFWIGPWVCNPKFSKVAKQMLNACLTKILEETEKTRVKIGVPAVNTQAVKAFKQAGFRVYSRSIRMSLGRKNLKEKLEGIYAIGGPEKG